MHSPITAKHFRNRLKSLGSVQPGLVQQEAGDLRRGPRGVLQAAEHRQEPQRGDEILALNQPGIVLDAVLSLVTRFLNLQISCQL